MSGLNGHGSMNGTPSNGAVDAGLGENDTSEHQRLEFEIAAATARTAAALARAAALDAQVQADMRHELVASRETVEEMERNHATAIALIREEARTEADRILEEARQQAASARGVRNAG